MTLAEHFTQIILAQMSVEEVYTLLKEAESCDGGTEWLESIIYEDEYGNQNP